MNKALPLFLAIIIATLLVFTACKDDDPTSPNDNNNNVVTDPNPPDYPQFIYAWFHFSVEVTKQYDTYSEDWFTGIQPYGRMRGSFNGGVFYADTTVNPTSTSEQTEQLTITMDTLTGVMSNLEFHRFFEDDSTDLTMSVSLSNINRTDWSSNYLVYSDSGMATCGHINTLDCDYNNYAEPWRSYVYTSYECSEVNSDIEVSLSTY